MGPPPYPPCLSYGPGLPWAWVLLHILLAYHMDLASPGHGSSSISSLPIIWTWPPLGMGPPPYPPCLSYGPGLPWAWVLLHILLAYHMDLASPHGPPWTRGSGLGPPCLFHARTEHLYVPVT